MTDVDELAVYVDVSAGRRVSGVSLVVPVAQRASGGPGAIALCAAAPQLPVAELELYAMQWALQALRAALAVAAPQPRRWTVYSDSRYAVDAASSGCGKNATSRAQRLQLAVMGECAAAVRLFHADVRFVRVARTKNVADTELRKWMSQNRLLLANRRGKRKRTGRSSSKACSSPAAAPK